MAYNITRAVALGGSLYGLGLANRLLHIIKTIKMRFIQEIRKVNKEIEKTFLTQKQAQKFLLVA